MANEPGADQDLTEWQDAGLFVEDKPIAGTVGDEDVVVVRHGGRLCAVAGRCTHLGAPLADGILVDGKLRCPWHHARFSIETGEAVGGPAFAPLARFDVVEENGRVRVTGKAAPAAADDADADVAPAIGRVVIVGGGAAGHACADMLARAGVGNRVMLLSADADAPYDRTFCSKQYLAGAKDRDDAMLPVAALGREPGIDLRVGVEVVRIDPDGKTIETDAGDTLPYDTLVLATGAAPVVPSIAGGGMVHVVRTLADADALIAAAGKARTVIVVGASYIGLEAAASLIQRGLAVTVVAEGDVPLEKTAGPEVGGMVRDVHADKGVVFRMGATVARWDGTTATLDDGSTVTADLLVAGTGVKPRLDLAEAAGLALADDEAGGVKVDATLRTSAPGIYAIGDIASVPDPRLGHPIRVEHWVVAQRIGQWLARHLLGAVEGGYTDIPFFWSGHYDTSLRYVGHVAGPGDRTTDGSIADKDVAVTFREDDRPAALLTCGRDVQSLETEALWER